jgi:hypothetical protein
MTDFKTLDPETRAYALVGKFLSDWAYMEYKINDAIGKALGLDAMQEVMVTSNIQFRDKIHILRTAIHHTIIRPVSERDRLKSVLTKISEYSTTRNMMAHTAFVATPLGEVCFFVTKARGEVKMPEETWDIPKFEEAYLTLANYTEEAKTIISRIETASLVKALIRAPQTELGLTKGGLFGLGFSGLLGPQLLASLDSIPDQPTTRKEPQTPEAERE